jgi:hypothetical protein
MAIGKPSTSISSWSGALRAVPSAMRRAPQRRERVDDVVKSRFPCGVCGKRSIKTRANAVASNAFRTL